MSILRGDCMKVIAQSIGIDDLHEDCVRVLLPEVELRVRQIIQDGLKFQRHAKRLSLSTTHINQALRARNVEGLYGFGATGTTIKYRPCKGHPRLFFPEDEEIPLNELLNAPLPPIPMQPSVSIHWLAVEGVQPLIPENESLENDSSCRTSIKDDAFVNQTERKPLVKHVLTEEMQLYYTKVTEVVKNDDFSMQRAALASLAQDPGIHQLLPYFSRFIYEEVKHSNRDLTLLFSLMRMCRCLMVNQHVRIELYLHQLLPAILTCVLGKQLCENPVEDHWSLRKYAAHLVAQICQRFGETYQHIQARVSKTYHNAITDPQYPWSTQYGALYGLMYLGPLVMDNCLFPNLFKYIKRLEPALSSLNPNMVERLEAQNCFGILVHASGMYLSMAKDLEQGTCGLASASMQLLCEAFGESLVPYINQRHKSTALNLCL